MNLNRSRSVQLNDGHVMPMLGFGTPASDDIGRTQGTTGLAMNSLGRVPKNKAGEVTKVAIDVGFLLFDAAYVYQNEEGVALERSLKALQMNYVDLFIIHLPIAMKPGEEIMPNGANGEVILETVDLCDTWAGTLEKCKDAGLTRSIGVSNFNHKQLEMIMKKPGLKSKPVCNQVECHPYLKQSKLLEFCKSKDTVLVAYSALGSQKGPTWVEGGSPSLLEEPILNAIAKKHNRNPGQVALRFQLYSIWFYPSFQVFDFELTPEDMKAIEGLNRNFRYFKLLFAVDHSHYPFSEEN
ncbi:unnamed protein product [Nyctereutes procyonoides]|uniref:(raccoon dog) hypothetical protein n=1 Tax=Nyctereutes procyonoides TaxID=34880 RepID=A0A811YUV2_NYCPR|nr:unnamed protein product [Nyctereutes procyonoides]